MKQLSLAQQLALLLACERKSAENSLTESVDQRVRMKVLFIGEYGIALALYTDGFNPSKRGGLKMTIIHFVILKYPPEIRYKNSNMIQVYITPGPEAPRDLLSYLQPTMRELEIPQTAGLKVETNSREITKVHLLLATGDIPVVT
ncbi:hypothetical protein EC973_005915, partial [Apophysomyces ossiformis]